ncbi:MAG: Fe-S cluster assembly protein SufD [Candidatus Latescibacterota bacterium]
MTQIADRTEWYVSAFSRFADRLDGESVMPVHMLRRRAIERFGALGLPSTRDEAWKHTSVAPIARVDFAPVLEPDFAGVRPADLAPFLVEGMDGCLLVFVDGHYAAHLSPRRTLPSGVRVTSLATALQADPRPVEAQLGRHATGEGEAFTALNTAFLRDGAFVQMPRGTRLQEPLHLLFVATERPEPTVSHPRVLFLAGEDSEVSLVESHASLGTSPSFTNAVTEVVAGRGAVVDYYRIQRQSLQAFHVSDLVVHQEGDVRFRATSIDLGGRLVRNRVHTVLAGRGIDSTLNGLYLGGGQQHIDNHTLVEHVEPHGSSHELYKGVLSDRATGVFRGRIHVHRAAQKTDAYQANRNLLLSEGAGVNAKPQLEIYADDVKCSHGTTVGRLDEDAVFYLRARGIGEAVARQMLTRAFAGQIVERVQIEPLRACLDELVQARLAEALHSAEALP